MNKISISISMYAFLLVGLLCSASFAQSDAANAALIFAEAGELQKSFANPTDSDLVAGLKELQALIQKGNRFLLNRDVNSAKVVAELVRAQMELVQMLGKLAELKLRLLSLQESSVQLQLEKARLMAQHRRLILLRDGRILTGAYPPSTDERDTTMQEGTTR